MKKVLITGANGYVASRIIPHLEKKFDEIDYCKNCDFLYEDPEAIVWTNDKEHKLYNMLGTGEDFILTQYKNR